MIVFNNITHGRLIAAAIPITYNADTDPVISNCRGERLLGGVIFREYTGSCIFMSQAGFDRHWMTRDMGWVVSDYAFNQLNCKKICGTVSTANKDLLAINLRLGFRVEALITDAYPDGDMAVLSMTREECRWLNFKPRGLRVGVS